MTAGVPSLPDLPAPFVAAGEHIRCSLPGGEVLFTTRRGGVSQAPYDTLNLGPWTDDDEAAIEVNRDRLAALAGVPRERIAQGRQVHGSHVRRLREPAQATRPTDPADGQATALPGVAVLVLTADCLPVALVADGAVAIVHAGWRGIAAGILEEGVAALRELGGRGGVQAAIGPGAGVCCYEVGDEVHAALDDARGRRGDRADLGLIARGQLEAAGVAAVHDCALCTLCAPAGLLFSHRRDGATGRQAGVVWRS